MVNKNDRWSALSMSDRADLIKLYVSNGITSLNDIKKDYNSFGDGGSKGGEVLEFLNNVVQTPNRAVKGELMDLFQTLQHGIEASKYKIAHNKQLDSGVQNYFTNEYSDPAQTSFLFSRKEQERAMLNSGYIKGTPKDYGLVARAVGDRDLPVYQKQKDDAYVGNLRVLGNIENKFFGAEGLEHAGSFPTTIYVDKAGNIFQKAWDLQDYGVDSVGNAGTKYNKGVQQLANVLNFIGNPIVRTTGLQKLNKQQQKYLLAELKSEELKNSILDSSSLGNELMFESNIGNIRYGEYVDYINSLVKKDKNYHANISFDDADKIREEYQKLHPFEKYMQLHHPEIVANPLYQNAINGGKINSFGDGGNTDGDSNNATIPTERKLTLEEFLQAKADSTRVAAHVKSLSRDEGVEIIYPLSESRKEANQQLVDQYYDLNPEFIGPTLPSHLGIKPSYDQAVKELNNNCEYGLNCIGTATDNYPEDSREVSNESFRGNYEEKGFYIVPFEEKLPGDIVQQGGHSVVFDSYKRDPHPTLPQAFGDAYPVYNYSNGGIGTEVYRKQKRYPFSNPVVYRYKGTPALIQQWTEEYNTQNKKFGGLLNSFDTGGPKDSKHVEDVVRTTRGSTGKIFTRDFPWVDFEGAKHLWDSWRVMRGSDKKVAPSDDNYTGTAMKGVGVQTDDGLGFASQQDLANTLGYTPKDFVDTYVYGDTPFEELGVFKKLTSPERHVVRSKVKKVEDSGKQVNTYQTQRDTLDTNTVAALDSLLNAGLVDLRSENTTYQKSPFNIGDSGIIYDGNNSTIATAYLPNGMPVSKAIDVFDTDPKEWNYSVGPMAKKGLSFIHDNTNPFIMTTPWYYPIKSTDYLSRLYYLFGIDADREYNVRENKGDKNGVIWELSEALEWLDNHPDLTEMPVKDTKK